MDPALARSRPAPASRPPAVPLVEPVVLPAPSQPVLPWTVVPQVVAPDSPLDPGLRQLATSLMSALVEVLSGQRSALQLELWVVPDVLALLEHLRAARPSLGLRLHSVRVQAPHEEALEVSAHLREGGVSRAAALRISRRRGRWVATHLVISLDAGVVHRAGWINPLEVRVSC
ncbi:MAG: Rv3235 family protein [Propionicimonas sp.]|uniref:Rv3235 family protein n=1 Tax=Propionicimonas sp. TaxID=1955623 RepID=UPI003D0F0DCE